MDGWRILAAGTGLRDGSSPVVFIQTHHNRIRGQCVENVCFAFGSGAWVVWTNQPTTNPTDHHQRHHMPSKQASRVNKLHGFSTHRASTIRELLPIPVECVEKHWSLSLSPFFTNLVASTTTTTTTTTIIDAYHDYSFSCVWGEEQFVDEKFPKLN